MNPCIQKGKADAAQLPEGRVRIGSHAGFPDFFFELTCPMTVWAALAGCAGFFPCHFLIPFSFSGVVSFPVSVSIFVSISFHEASASPPCDDESIPYYCNSYFDFCQ
jgi:hypothetical protein